MQTHTLDSSEQRASSMEHSRELANEAEETTLDCHGKPTATEDAETSDADKTDEPEDSLELDLEEHVGDGQTKYDLRQKARELKASFSRTWIDDDKTGFYDPKEELRQLRQRPKRPNALLKRASFRPWDLDEDDDSESESEARKDRAPIVRPSLEVKLTFRSEAGKAAFNDLVRNLPAKPEPSEELFSERRLRRRDSGVDFSYLLGAKPTKKSRLSDDLPEDLTGHPVARGCWECLTIGIRCPLLENERYWPCTTCLDDDHECELLTPPTYKRPCEHCKGKLIGCSYTYTLDHDGPCEECSRTGGRCVAGPAKEAIRERISYDRDWANDPWQESKPPKPKKLPSCRRCRERDQLCSFSAGDKSDVCTSCDMATENCQPELGMKSSRKRKRPQAKAATTTGKSNNDYENVSWGPDILGENTGRSKPIIIGSSSESSSDDSSDTPPPPPPKKNRSKAKHTTKEEGSLETISTKFAHPIRFNYEGQDPCHFCSDIRFSMFGLGSTEVEVVVWNDGRGLDEISGGHRGQGIESTRMCVSCTTSRIPIVMCGKHKLQPLEGESPHSLSLLWQMHIDFSRCRHRQHPGEQSRPGQTPQRHHNRQRALVLNLPCPRTIRVLRCWSARKRMRLASLRVLHGFGGGQWRRPAKSVQAAQR